MSGKRIARFGLPTVLVATAVFGPWGVGDPGTPAVAPSAAQLLPPGERVDEVRIVGGGFARALELIPTTEALHLRSSAGWRELSGVRADGPVTRRTMLLGTDHQGRDLFARTIAGTRRSLSVAALAVLATLLIGCTVGIGTSLAPRAWRSVLTAATDAALGLPRLLLLLMLAVMLGGDLWGTAFGIGLVSWMEFSRLVTAETDALRARPFYLAVRAAGAGRGRQIARHVAPNLWPLIAAAAPLLATDAILLESTLAYLGLTGGTDTVSWGRIVADGQRLLPRGAWIVALPGLALLVTALAFHGLADDRRVRH